MSAGPSRDPRRILLPLIGLAAACTGLILAAAQVTESRIETGRAHAILRVMGDIIPSPYDNDPLEDPGQIRNAAAFGSRRPVNVYTARRGSKVRGFVFMPVAADGYNGAIRLAVGVRRDGRLSGVRVLDQHETPGLGAAVDQHQSGWIHRFRGRSLANTPPGRWRVSADGGDFDALSGATITSRGVINAVHAVLGYYHRNSQHLLEAGN